MGLLDNDEPSAEELQAMQERAEQERETRQQEQQLAAQYSDQQAMAKDELLGLVENLGLDSDHHGDNLEEYLSAELSHIYALSDFTPKDIEKFDWRAEQDAWLARNEMADPDAALAADDERIMYGENRARLSNSRQRRLRSAQSAKKALNRMARGGNFLAAMTEIRAVAESFSDDSEADDEGGLLSSLV
jgi:hypothetical protein